MSDRCPTCNSKIGPISASMLSRQCEAEFDMKEAHMLRQWFDHVFDTNPHYLEYADLVLGTKLYEACGMRVSNALRDALQNSTPRT